MVRDTPDRPADTFARARKELRAAERELGAMRAALAASDWGAYEDAWRGLLSALGQCWNAVQHAGAGRGGQAFARWFSTHSALRKGDPLLRYLHQARHASEHAAADSAAVRPASVTVRYPQGGGVAHGLVIDVARNRLYYHGSPGAELTSEDERVELVRVQNRGVWYNPPTQHLGASLAATDPVAVGTAGLAYCAAMVDDAVRTFR